MIRGEGMTMVGSWDDVMRTLAALSAWRPGSAYNQRGPEKSVMEPSRRVVLTDIVKGVRPEEPAPDGRVAVRRD